MNRLTSIQRAFQSVKYKDSIFNATLFTELKKILNVQLNIIPSTDCVFYRAIKSEYKKLGGEIWRVSV